MKYCHCTKPPFAFESSRVEVLVGASIPGPIWVCDNCNGVNHAFQFIESDVVMGPLDAIGPLGSVGHINGQVVTTWATPRGHVKIIEFRTYPRIVPMSERDPLIFTVWNHLQTKVDVILRPPNGPSDNTIEAGNREMAKSEARGIAEVLAILMSPFMESSDMVVKHAVKFYKDSSHEVPGLGLHLWDSMLNSDGTPRTVIAAPKPAATASRTVAKPKRADSKSTALLADKDIAGVKAAVESGSFTVEDVAAIYKVSIESVKKALI